MAATAILQAKTLKMNYHAEIKIVLWKESEGARMKTYHGIDISHWNTVTSWAKVHDDNEIDFIILKAGGGDSSYTYKDPKFLQYYNACKMYEIPVGAYYYCPSSMVTSEQGIKAATEFLKMLSGLQFEMPVFLDIESTALTQKKGATDAAIAFCDHLEKRGYFVGIYSSDISGFKERLDVKRLSRFTLWVARYGMQPSYTRNYGIWQYSSKGIIEGIRGQVDLDVSFKNYPKIIKGGKFNGFT